VRAVRSEHGIHLQSRKASLIGAGLFAPKKLGQHLLSTLRLAKHPFKLGNLLQATALLQMLISANNIRYKATQMLV
jgi:hypothetical protein